MQVNNSEVGQVDKLEFSRIIKTYPDKIQNNMNRSKHQKTTMLYVVIVL